MYDVLYEALQKRDMAIARAEKSIRHYIGHVEGMKRHKGEKIVEVESAVDKTMFNTVYLTDNKKLVFIHHDQFLTSMTSRMKTQLFPQISAHKGMNSAAGTSAIISEISILDEDNWPMEISSRCGRNQLKSLCERFCLIHMLSKTISVFVKKWLWNHRSAIDT